MERNIKCACVSMLLCVTSKYALFQKVCVKIASSIMPGVKMLRQNFVSASNKSPKDKRVKLLNLSHFKNPINHHRWVGPELFVKTNTYNALFMFIWHI